MLTFFLTAATVKKMNRTLTTRNQLGASRQKIVETLATGAVIDKSGRATAILMEKTGYEGSLTGISSLLLAMERSGTIKRELKGKRCFSISLINPQRSTPAATPAKKPSTQPATPPAQTLDSPVIEGLDVAALAKSLLDQVIDIASKPGRNNAQMQQLQQERTQLHQRLFEATERAEKSRQRIRLLEDEVAAKKVEADGLRRRLGETERNLNAILSAPNGMRLDVERERELRELIKLMKAPDSRS